MNPIVILHGWSDTSESFTPLADWLKAHDFNVVPIYLGDYLSMNDEVTLQDLGFAFQRALKAKGIAQTPHSFDVIVHSTGGLVVREYLRQVCRGEPQKTPVEHLLMLAPANFGSPLAKLGKSVLGRILKGWDWDHFGETGKAILEGLELASPYSFQLALDDLFDPRNAIFDPANTRVTVMVGTGSYDNYRKALHENGSDGTVRVSTANLNANLLRVNFADPNAPEHTFVQDNCPRLAFAVLDRNHSTIYDPALKTQAADWARLVQRALTVPVSGYSAHVADCAAVTSKTFVAGGSNEKYHQYQHIVFYVHDQFGRSVDDYMVEFYQEEGDRPDRVFTKIHGEILEKVTTYSGNSAYRSFLFDITDLEKFFAQRPNAKVQMSITAAAVSSRISYRNPPGGITVFSAKDRKFMRANEPTLVDVTLYRDPSPDVFKLTLRT
jgi:pimeloyl-ACP methyl ester carboxylesterase